MDVDQNGQCKECLEPIVKGASICPTCGSFQDHRRRYTWTLPVVSLLLAFALGIPTIVDIWKLMFYTPRSMISIVSMDYVNQAISADTVNLGDVPGVVGEQIQCSETFNGDGRLSLIIVGKKRVVVFPVKTQDVEWNTWNAYVSPASATDPTPEQISAEVDALLAKYPTDPTDPNATSESADLANSLSQGPFAPMYDKFRYYLVLAGRVQLQSQRTLPDEFDFACNFDVSDGPASPYQTSFNLSFGPGFYSLDYLPNVPAQATP